MKEQLHALFLSMINKTSTNTVSPLVRVGNAVLQQQPDINASQMSLSMFNVLLSRNHGRNSIPAIGFIGAACLVSPQKIYQELKTEDTVSQHLLT